MVKVHLGAPQQTGKIFIWKNKLQS